jgi:hypothetical protein
VKANDCLAQSRLAAARLADQAKRFSRLYRKTDVVDGPNRQSATRKEATANLKVFLQVLDLEQRFGCAIARWQ